VELETTIAAIRISLPIGVRQAKTDRLIDLWSSIAEGSDVARSLVEPSYYLWRRDLHRLAARAAAPPTRASAMVGSSGESSQPVWARRVAVVANNIDAAKITYVNFLIDLPFAMVLFKNEPSNALKSSTTFKRRTRG
jgi:hypothetical protein